MWQEVWQQEGLNVAGSVAARGFECGSGVAATQVSGHVFPQKRPQYHEPL